MKKLLVIATLSVSLAFQALSQTFLTNGLVAYYPFIGNANDASGNGNNGMVQGATLTTNHLGTPNSAYYFNGIAEIVLPPAEFTNINQGAITAWIKLNANDQATIFGKQHNGANSYAFLTVGSYEDSGGYQDSGTPGTLYFHADNAEPLASSTTLIPTGAWCQVAVVFSATNCDLYINGSQSGAYSGNFAVPADASIIAALGVQEIDGVYSYGLNGSMDDVRIYDTPLSSNQIAQLYAFESLSASPVIITNLTNVIAVAGAPYSLSGLAGATTNVSYQWYFTNGTPQGLAGAYAKTVSGFVYGAVVTNGGFGYGNIPSVRFVGGGGSGASGYGAISNGALVSITVTNAGTGYTSLPTVVIDPPDGLLLGQTNNTLVLDPIGTNDIGDYWFVATTAAGSVTSQIANLVVVYPPTIVTPPDSTEAPWRGTVTLSVTAAGAAPLQYQWSFAGTNLAAATNSVLSLEDLNTNMTGFYSVTVFNPYGQVTSAPAEIAISPTITVPFTGTVGLWGQLTTLSVGVVGTGPIYYQWLQNGVPISGATNGTLSFSSIQFTNAGLYSVVVSSSFGSVTNGAYEVVVNPANISLGLYPGVTIAGTVGYTYQIQASTNLSNPSGWVTETNITLVQPLEIWFDASANTTRPGSPHKFYQVVAGN